MCVILWLCTLQVTGQGRCTESGRCCEDFSSKVVHNRTATCLVVDQTCCKVVVAVWTHVSPSPYLTTTLAVASSPSHVLDLPFDIVLVCILFHFACGRTMLT